MRESVEERSGRGKGAAALVHELTGDASAPTVVTLQVTDRCNYDCVHCYQTHEEMPELTTDEIDRLLGDLAAAGVLFLTLMGGELFVRRDADEILRIARSHGFAVKLKTTGHFINDRRADLIRDLGAVEVHLSCYSANHVVHDAVTLQPGSWQRTLGAAKRLLARRVPVALITPVMAGNVADLAELARLATDLGAHYAFDPKLTGRRDGDNSPTAMRPSIDQLQSFYEDATISLFAATTEHTAARHSPLGETPCHAGSGVVAINPQGDVWPCNVLPVACGNVREQSFADIWRSSPQLQRLRGLAWGRIATCRDCALRPYCGRCHAMALLEDGDIAGPSLESCRHAVATRDALRAQGLIPDTETAMPPTWDRVVASERDRTSRGVRCEALKVLQL